MNQQSKQKLMGLAKLLLVVGLFYYLIDSGRLKLDALNIFLEKPIVLVAALLHWFLFPILFCFLRWFLLLRGMGLQITYWRTLHLQLIGLFFNTAMPGSVGGDLVKAVYVIRDHPGVSKTKVMMTILLDRVLGLSGLFVVASMAILLDVQAVWEITVMKPIVIAILGATAAILVIGGIILGRFTAERDPLAKVLKKSFPGAKALNKLYEALCIYRGQPRTIIYALLLSMALQAGGMFYFYLIAYELLGVASPLASFAAVFSVGVLVTALPLLPGGLGVGHVAFDRLFLMIGLSRGADVFNIYVLGMLALNMFGAVPYLLIRKKDVPSAYELAQSEGLS